MTAGPLVGRAKKAVNVVGKKSPLSPDAQAIATLAARLAAIEVATSDLHNQTLASSGLITTLAEQNTRLIQRIDVNRPHLTGLACATFVL